MQGPPTSHEYLGERDQRRLRIFHEAELVAVRASAQGLGKPASETFMARLCAAGSTRPLIPPVPTWEANLEWLSHVFPKFEEVVESGIRPSLQTAVRGGLQRPTPLLLTGTTEQEVVAFVGAVARVLDLPFFESTRRAQQTGHAASRRPSSPRWHLARIRTPPWPIQSGWRIWVACGRRRRCKRRSTSPRCWASTACEGLKPTARQAFISTPPSSDGSSRAWTLAGCLWVS